MSVIDPLESFPPAVIRRELAAATNGELTCPSRPT
jgi:hypothetical protein